MKKRTFFRFRVILLVVLSGVMESSKKSLVAERWVINVSPVIALAQVGHVELLVGLPKQSVIPRSVADELLRAPEDDPARRAIEGGILESSQCLMMAQRGFSPR